MERMTMLNRVELRGIIGPLKISNIGETKVARFGVMTCIAYKNADNYGVVDTTWTECVAFESDKISLEGLEKRAKVHVIGRLHDQKFTGADGFERTTKQLMVSELEIINSETLEYENV